MIKLIACDLDGTLLTPDGELPEGTFSVIGKLYEKGILFCPASGRQLTALEQMFGPVRDKVAFIAENGAIVSCRGELLRCVTIPRETVLRALAEVKKLPDAHPLLCTPECAYYEEGSQPFLEYVAASYISNAQRSLAETARTERICKIAVYDGKGPENNGMKALPAALPDMRVIQSGGNWLDISARDTDKGNALRFLLKKLDVAREECAAFGDHMNDYEMLLECGHPYVPANAYPPLLEKIGTVVSSNAENGVLREMERIAEQN
ncbi:MAG TPA: Cof-type HAD-IIB family hydrolase [Candidatus Borkfalkia avicola]|uniref:Cof-type HAD-IIB family hydrolase n=1 Tax=Candidatus Borkfalkia avicola TaxID=2838503 RepID=A0A9D2D7K5_9FIRM|nr:Cof-type HAD-IIB family hydrolase [Candidatus Borkfalkia avicola]